uniref:Uncharacterized protein n=1 Tax=Rhizophora mucronata TaxID=61149 RepID=A0A2P2P519_RHIMU
MSYWLAEPSTPLDYVSQEFC